MVEMIHYIKGVLLMRVHLVLPQMYLKGFLRVV